MLGIGVPEEDLARYLEAYQQGLTLYRQGNWSQSASALEEALRLRPQDQLAQRYLLLSQKCQQEPPGADWSPVTVMTQK